MLNTIIVPDHELRKFVEKLYILCTRFANDLFQVPYYFHLQNTSISFMRRDLLVILESFF